MEEDPYVVPTRSGHRQSVKVLRVLNYGRSFRCVREIASGEVFVVHSTVNDTHFKIWRDAFRLHMVDASKYEPCSLEAVPALSYEETQATIGGIGKHVRWFVASPKKKLTDELSIVVDASRTEFVKQIVNEMHPFVEWDGTVDDNMIADMKIPVAVHAQQVIARFHMNAIEATFAREEDQAISKLGIERFDRSDHMWWNQSRKNAGPLRDMHRWHFGWIPHHWKYIPFTWESLSRNATDLGREECANLPLPLRNHVCTAIIERLKSENGDRSEILAWLSMTHPACVTSRLTREQNIQLLSAAYFLRIAPFDQERNKIAVALSMAYLRYGYISRDIGGYQQSAKHLGHGAFIRKFKRHTQYQPANLSVDVLNKIYQPDGSLRGSGYKGTRGKYGHPRFKKYKASRKMERKQSDERDMRVAIVDEISAFNDVARTKQG
jgi:hypothetical protein